MNVHSVDELYNYNFSINVVNAMNVHWHTQESFNCINSPKKVNMLLYLDECSAEYTLKNGKKLYAHSGDITYTPVGSEYSIRFYDLKTPQSGTYGINFFLFDPENQPFRLCDNHLKIFHIGDGYNYKLLFSKVVMHSEAAVPCYGKMKAGIYDILLNLSAAQKLNRFNRYELISAGILYMEENIDQELSISEIADMCNVSETYFRRLFREYSGLTPMEYRMVNKINRAKLHLEYDDLAISEIAEILHFTDTAYFSKQFKTRVGMTPMEYKKTVKEKACR